MCWYPYGRPSLCADSPAKLFDEDAPKKQQQQQQLPKWKSIKTSKNLYKAKTICNFNLHFCVFVARAMCVCVWGNVAESFSLLYSNYIRSVNAHRVCTVHRHKQPSSPSQNDYVKGVLEHL